MDHISPRQAASKFGHTISVEAQLQQMDIRCRDRHQISPGHLRQLLSVNLTLFLQYLLAMSHLVDTSFTPIQHAFEAPAHSYSPGRILRAIVHSRVPHASLVPPAFSGYLFHIRWTSMENL